MKTVMNKQEVTIVDVRTPVEFLGGHVAGAKNIPLSDIRKRLDELKSFTSPIVLCCASGARSGQAEIFLKQQGIECINGGSWTAVNNSLVNNN